MPAGSAAQLDTALNAASAFGEDQGRYLVSAPQGIAIPNATQLGSVGGDSVAGISLARLREASDSFFRDWMEN